MKTHSTQKLYWKKWPYKVILQLLPIETDRIIPGAWKHNRSNRIMRLDESNRIKGWCQTKFTDFGFRREMNLSIFLHTEDEVDTVLCSYGHLAIELWAPANDASKELLLDHVHDVIRATPWYGKFPIRALIPYSQKLRNADPTLLKTAVATLDVDGWAAAGMIGQIVKDGRMYATYAWGQPMYLYLKDDTEAAMLRLQLGGFIERFERIRKPS